MVCPLNSSAVTSPNNGSRLAAVVAPPEAAEAEVAGPAAAPCLPRRLRARLHHGQQLREVIGLSGGHLCMAAPGQVQRFNWPS